MNKEQLESMEFDIVYVIETKSGTIMESFAIGNIAGLEDYLATLKDLARYHLEIDQRTIKINDLR
jgi:hypothetical protein